MFAQSDNDSKTSSLPYVPSPPIVPKNAVKLQVLDNVQQLDQQLENLRESASANRKTLQRANQDLWHLLARTLLWSLEADKSPGYKESLYRAHGVRWHRTADGSPNFSPLIRLVWGFASTDLSQADRVTISQWNTALKAIYAHYIQNPDDFRFNAEGKLVDFIAESRGVAGLNGASPDHNENDNDFRDDDANDNDDLGDGNDRSDPTNDGDGLGPNPNPDPKKDRSNLDSENHEKITRAVRSFIVQSNGIGTATLKTGVRVASDNLVVLLARHENDDTLTVLGSTSNSRQINLAVEAIASGSLTVLPYSLRALSEVIKSQAFPPKALPPSGVKRANWYRNKYNEKVEAPERDQNGSTRKKRGRRHTTVSRLVIRAESRDVLLSMSGTDVSPVTRCKLHHQLVDNANTVYLNADHRVIIERWLETGEIFMLEAATTENLVRECSSEEASYKLDVRNRSTEESTTLRFEPGATSATDYQPDFDADKFAADWTVELDLKWFLQLRKVWADPWFGGLGLSHQITRDRNRKLEIEIDGAEVRIGFNREDGHSAFESFALPDNLSGLVTPARSTYLSKDLAPILFNMADANVDGAVTMSGNQHALVFQYANSIGSFAIAVPSLQFNGRRDGTLFYAWSNPSCP
ncbi:hypothetical protein RA307_22495 [Xanthobacteraceae bacterium Astr-EGSB]|uniref:hypothetical protein n=1 Tax=Astrobacterium formosum TaxID=3069710 RepID=UPI0027B4BF67|nr:hypothetical protein [Xanthobacteraceae bacterium Astr-EGSB]